MTVRIAAGAAVAAATVALAAMQAGPGSPRSTQTKVWPKKCITDVPRTPNGQWIFPELRTLRTQVWATGIYWSQIALTRPGAPRSPADVAYRWPEGLDQALDNARNSRIEPVLHVNGFPSWSNGGRDSSWAAKNPADYADFMAAAVARYPQVRRWIVFAEPSHYVNFRPQGGRGRRAPRLYAQFLDAAYDAMHSVRRDVIVIGGNIHPAGANDQTTTAPDTFVRHMVLPNGRRPRMDIFGVNPYTERSLNLALPHRRGRVDFNDLDWLVRELDRYWPRRRLRLFIEEFGWNTEHEGAGWLYFISRKKQAKRLSTAYRLAAEFGRVDTMCWYLLYDTPPSRRGAVWWNWTSGLRTATGEKKPSWHAFRRVPRPPSSSR